MQVSPSGRFVATFFMKTVFIYSTKRPALPPLKLYHTREITVSPFPSHVTCSCNACLLQPDAYDTSIIEHINYATASGMTASFIAAQPV